MPAVQQAKSNLSRSEAGGLGLQGGMTQNTHTHDRDRQRQRHTLLYMKNNFVVLVENLEMNS